MAELVYKLKKQREKGFLYFVKFGEDGFLEVWKAKLKRGRGK